MDTISLIDLGPVIAAVLGPMLAFVAVSMRYQHVDSTKTRELIASSEKETRELIASSEETTRELIASSEEATRELIASSEETTRELIASSEETTRELIERTGRETLERGRELIDGIGTDLVEHKDDTKESLRELTRGLTDARERLARIEGRLGIGAPLPDLTDANNKADAA